MPLIFKNSGGDEAPEIEDGIYPADFMGVTLEPHPDWAGVDSFGKPDNGDRLRFSFTAYVDGDPVPLSALTRTATGERSNAYKMVKSLLTKAEQAEWEAGGFDAEVLNGRRCQVVVEHNKNKWPFVAQVVPVGK